MKTVKEIRPCPGANAPCYATDQNQIKISATQYCRLLNKCAYKKLKYFNTYESSSMIFCHYLSGLLSSNSV